MTKVEILNTIGNIKKGTFTRITYVSEPTLSAAGKKAGVSIIKHTRKTVRLGVQYQNMEAVKEKEAMRTEPKREVAPWCHWEIDDILAKHNMKEAYYLACSYVNGRGHNTESEYYLNGELVTPDILKASGYIVPSYFKEDREPAVTQRINIENIIRIGSN